MDSENQPSDFVVNMHTLDRTEDDISVASQSRPVIMSAVLNVTNAPTGGNLGGTIVFCCVFLISAISPYTTGLKVLFNQSDCTGTTPTHK